MKQLLAVILSLFFTTSVIAKPDLFVSEDVSHNPVLPPKVIKIDSNYNITDFIFNGNNGVESLIYKGLDNTIYGFYPQVSGPPIFQNIEARAGVRLEKIFPTNSSAVIVPKFFRQINLVHLAAR